MNSRQNDDKNKTIFASAVLFLLPALAMTTTIGLSLIQIVILLAFLWYLPQGMGRYYAEHARTLRWVLIAIGGYFLSSLVRMLLTTPSWQPLDGPSRLLFGLACIGFAGWLRPRAHWFWLGLCVGAIGAGGIAAVQHFGYGAERAEGFTRHSITFGDLSLALGLMALCGLDELRKSRMALLPVAALLFGVMASVLSGSRGGWLALPLALLPLLRHSRLLYGKLAMYGGALAAALFGMGCVLPSSGAAQRLGLAVTEAQRYFSLGDATTSVGIRFELWKASWLMFGDNPWLGAGRRGFDAALQALAKQGRLQESPALTFSSSHNDMLFFLATGGLIDFGLLLLIYGAPLALFVATLRRADRQNHAAALAGVMLVSCFIVFGLTDVMFWLMIPKAFYTMMVGVLIGLCLQRAPGP